MPIQPSVRLIILIDEYNEQMAGKKWEEIKRST
jgi:hypothetical protein